METASPYTPPKTDLLGDQEAQYGAIKLFTAKGRIGRLRYIAYTVGFVFVYYLVVGASSAIGVMSNAQASIGVFVAAVTALGFGLLLFVNILLTIQRCHDFNTSGWLSLALLIPLVPFIFWLIPGTEGGNRYGPQPPPNKGAALVIVVILLLIMVIGILAAIAIPAYQQYVAQAAAARL